MLHVLVDRSLVVKEIQKIGNDVRGWAFQENHVFKRKRPLS
jgi:hypothetical protein